MLGLLRGSRAVVIALPFRGGREQREHHSKFKHRASLRLCVKYWPGFKARRIVRLQSRRNKFTLSELFPCN